MFMLTTSLYIENNIKSVSVGQKILQLIRLQLFGKNTRRRSFCFVVIDHMTHIHEVRVRQSSPRLSHPHRSILSRPQRSLVR